MGERWRVLDTGLREAAQNVAVDRSLLEARRAEEIPSTLRFSRHAQCVLVGAQQSLLQEVDLDYCRSENVLVQRRITSGMSVYLTDAHINWGLYLHRRDIGSDNTRALLKRVCHAVATAVSALGVDASFRAPDEVEVDGRRIGFASAVCDDSALLVDGVLLIDAAVERAWRVLRFPAVADVRGHVQDRIAGLKDLLHRRVDRRAIRQNIREAFESEFDVEFSDSDLGLSEQRRFEKVSREMDTPDWRALIETPADHNLVLVGERKLRTGVLRAVVMYEPTARCIRRVGFEGDIPLAPRRTLPDLEAALRGVPVSRVRHRIERFFASRTVTKDCVAPGDFAAAVAAALKHPSAISKE